MSINLDNNATTRPAPEVIAAITECLESDWGNPSSAHRRGIGARRRVELARDSVSTLLGCEPSEVIFTSGGTEAGNLAVVGGFEQVRSLNSRRTIVAAAATEHPAIRDAIGECARLGAEPRQLAVDRNGLVDLEALETFLKAEGDRCALLSVMWANNETGVIQPIEMIGRLCRDAGVLLHTDAVQWVGRMPCDFATLPIDLLSCSAHKFHGPKGAGALVIRRGVRVTPRSLGGSQERERRGGTENVPAIAGMGVACELARAWFDLDQIEQMADLRDHLEQGLENAIDGMVVHGRGVPRLWNTTNIAFPGTESQLMVVVLSERGLAVSGGAACASGSIQPSGVLLAMGIEPELAGSSLRLSLNRSSTSGMIDSATEILTTAVRAAQEA
jgi:cysteine desulfurase